MKTALLTTLAAFAEFHRFRPGQTYRETQTRVAEAIRRGEQFAEIKEFGEA